MDDVRIPRVVVGVSGSTASVKAVRWAARMAGALDGQLRVVLAWRPERVAMYAPGGQPSVDEERSRAIKRLDATMGAVFDPAPPGDVVTEIVTGAAERVLIDRSAGADLLVIGSALSPGAPGHLVGPVVRACIGRARCPVVVIGPHGVPGTLDPFGAHLTSRASAPQLAGAGSASGREATGEALVAMLARG
jgi:nucleotide-binding universal stress UspA family protein